MMFLFIGVVCELTHDGANIYQGGCWTILQLDSNRTGSIAPGDVVWRSNSDAAEVRVGELNSEGKRSCCQKKGEIEQHLVILKLTLEFEEIGEFLVVRSIE